MARRVSIARMGTDVAFVGSNVQGPYGGSEPSVNRIKAERWQVKDEYRPFALCFACHFSAFIPLRLRTQLAMGVQVDWSTDRAGGRCASFSGRDWVLPGLRVQQDAHHDDAHGNKRYCRRFAAGEYCGSMAQALASLAIH